MAWRATYSDVALTKDTSGTTAEGENKTAIP